MKTDEKLDVFEEVLPKLLKIQLFADFNPSDENDLRILRTVYSGLKLQTFKAGDEIIKEGEHGESFYILTAGSVQVLRNTMAGDRIALANLSSDMGIFFGETALIGTDTRGATVVATSDCRTCVITGKKFKEMCEKEPVLGYRVMFSLAKRMNATIKKANNDMATLYEALFDEVVN